jgi:hypothetical protein
MSLKAEFLYEPNDFEKFFGIAGIVKFSLCRFSSYQLPRAMMPAAQPEPMTVTDRATHGQRKPTTPTTTTTTTPETGSQRPAGQPDPRRAIASLISAAVAGMHPAARAAKPEWFDHLLKRCEAKAFKIATQAALSPYACGDATFAEVYAKTLPTLFTEALERLDNPEPD